MTRSTMGRFRSLGFEESPADPPAMTPAERKAKSRAMTLGGILGHIEAAEEALRLAEHELLRVPAPAREALDQVQLQLELAKSLVPKARGA